MYDDGSSTATELLTLLNVTATRAGKRKRFDVVKVEPKRKILKKRDATIFNNVSVQDPVTLPESVVDTKADDDESLEIIQSYEQHFGPSPRHLSEESRVAVDAKEYTLSNAKLGALGSGTLSTTSHIAVKDALPTKVPVLGRLRAPFQALQRDLPTELVTFQNDLLAVLSTHRDLYMPSLSLKHRHSAREALMLHALDHITKKRRRILKNNERLAAAAKASLDPPEDVGDQGFTRPSCLIVVPFRNSALAYINALLAHTPSPAYSVQNRERFQEEYGVPPGVDDKLTSADSGTYPEDHVATFAGNVDDSFRVGLRIKRSNIKIFNDFYTSDIILASPLGLRLAIEKEKADDFLSSIEIAIIDQMDTMTMQNWDHVQFLVSHLNKIPKSSHNADFSRIKPWYLDSQSAYLRQTILTSSYETPEMRALYNNSLINIEGKIRLEKTWSAIQVPAGVNHSFIRLDCLSPKDEADKRFDNFTNHVMPQILKSAVQSNSVLLFIPSSFDFIRVHDWFRQQTAATFAVLSEYSTNQDISRTRQSFFKGNVQFVLMSERFHFFRRYKIRGIRNLVFYAPPDHPQFYSEFLAYPFLDDDVQPEDISCRVLFSRYDWFRLERIAGTDGARELIQSM